MTPCCCHLQARLGTLVWNRVFRRPDCAGNKGPSGEGALSNVLTRPRLVRIPPLMLKEATKP